MTRKEIAHQVGCNPPPIILRGADVINRMDLVLNGRCRLLDQLGTELPAANKAFGVHGSQRERRDAGEDHPNILDNTIRIEANPAGKQSLRNRLKSARADLSVIVGPAGPALLRQW